MPDSTVRVVSLPERILSLVRERKQIRKPGQLTQYLADELQVIDDLTTAEALHVLREQGLVIVKGNDAVIVTNKGKTKNVATVTRPPEVPVQSGRAADKIMAYLVECGGLIEDPKGRCIATIEKELGIRHAGAAIATLVRRGLVEKDARPRVGTVSVRLVRQAHPVETLAETMATEVITAALKRLEEPARKRVLARVGGTL